MQNSASLKKNRIIPHTQLTSNPQHREILTPQEAADLLQISQRKLLDHVREGIVPGKKLKGVWRFSRDALLDYIKSPSVRAEKFLESHVSTA